MINDVLSDVLASMHVTGSVYFCDQLSWPWRKEFFQTETACFHQIRRGGCWLAAEGEQHYLGPGDFVFIEAGLDHVLTSDSVPGIEDDKNHPISLLLCGYVEFTHGVSAPLAGLFPRLTIMHDMEIGKHPWLKVVLEQLASEYLSVRPGTRLVVNKLTEVLVVELIRSNFGESTDTHLLGALSDRQVGQALQHIHTKPEYSWTLDTLAQKVGSSRAGFARKFRKLVGQTMFDYLTDLRLQRAREMLRETNLPIHKIAAGVGYESDLAFNRTFKKRRGETPTAYRKSRKLLNDKNKLMQHE